MFDFSNCKPTADFGSYEGLVRDFPEMYHPDGTLFRSLMELKRLLARDDVRRNEMLSAVSDIEYDLRNHLEYSIIDGRLHISYDLGDFSEKEARDILKGTAEMRIG